MINVRKNLFETNSSSTHAICISNKDTDYNMYIGSTIHYTLGQFARNKTTLTTFVDKLSYLMTTIRDINDYNKNRPNNNYDFPSYDKNYIKDVLHKCLNITIIECDDSIHYVECFADSIEWLNFIYNDETSLLRFLFSDNSIVVTSSQDCEYIDEDDSSDNETYIQKQTKNLNAKIFLLNN